MQIKPPTQPLSREAMHQAAECLRTLAHPCRLQMVQLLLAADQTVGQLAEACDIAPSVASEQLRKMADRGLLERRRKGRNTIYTIAEPGLAGIMHCIESRFGETP